MPITNYPFGIASYGLPVLPGGIPPTTGKVVFVCNATNANGSDGNRGTDPSQPLATVNAAYALCTANRGDLIIVMPGHAETVTATSIAHNVAGVQVIGLGSGALRPTFTFGAAAATITVSAANGGWSNCRFIANFLNVASAFTLSTAKNTTIANSDFLDTSNVLNFLCIVTTGATANDADGLALLNNYVYGLAATDGAVVSVLGDLLRLQVSYNVVDKPGVTSDTGHLITMSSKVCGGVRIIGNMLTCVALTSQSVGTLFTGSSTTSSGMCADNYVIISDTSSAIIATTGTKISFSQNFMGGVADGSGIVWPAGDTPS
jgi:hypothetical protein